MKALKFRAWSFTHKKFFHRVLVGNTETDNPCSSIWDDADCTWKEFDKFCGVIQQFTGVKDTNNINVYEGDLVEFIYANQPDIEDSKGVYEVFYSEKDTSYYLRVYKKNWLDTSFVTERDAKAKTIDDNCPAQSLTELPLSRFKICRVIGNIFENSKLLK
jgi:uncharacterized phage protein (TIGR01671 family)